MQNLKKFYVSVIYVFLTLSPRSHPRHLMGKRTALRDNIKDITSDSQVNSYFPYRLSPASLTFNIYFYLFLYLYITRTTINNDTPHLNSPKNQNRRAALGRPAIKLLGASKSIPVFTLKFCLPTTFAVILFIFAFSYFRVRKFTGTDRNGLNYRNEPEWTRFQLVFVIFTLNTQLFYSHTYFICPPA